MQSTHSFCLCVLRQVNSLFQSEFSTDCDLVLPLLIYSTPLILKVIQWLLTSSIELTGNVVTYLRNQCS
jgi:hypothetical protein